MTNDKYVGMEAHSASIMATTNILPRWGRGAGSSLLQTYCPAGAGGAGSSLLQTYCPAGAGGAGSSLLQTYCPAGAGRRHAPKASEQAAPNDGVTEGLAGLLK